MNETMYVVMSVQPWDTLSVTPVFFSGMNGRLKNEPPIPHMVGYLAVFDDYKAALEYVGGKQEQVMEVRRPQEVGK